MKLILKLLSLLIVLVLIVGGIFIWVFDINKYRDSISAELSQVLNRPVIIQKLAMKISLIPTISLSDVTIGNPDGFESKEPLAHADTVELTIALPPLLHQEIQIRDIQLKNATINFIQLKNNQNNITLPTNSKSEINSIASKPKNTISTTDNPYLAQLKVDTISIDKLTLNYQNGDQKEQVILSDCNIQQLKVLSTKILYREIPVQLTANMNLINLIQMNNNFIFNAQLTAFHSITKVSGSIGDMKNMKNILLNLEVVINNLSDIASKSGVSLPIQITDASLTSIIKGNLDRMDIQTFKLSLGKGILMDFKGSIDKLKTNPQGKISGTLSIQDSPITTQVGIKPMTVSLTAKGQNQAINISKLSFNANRSDIDSVLNINWDKDKINVVGSIDSNFLNLKDIYQNPRSDSIAQTKSVPQIKSDTQKKVAASNTNVLNKLDAQINWKLKNVELTENSGDYYGITGKTILKNGTFTANPLQIKTVAGIINAALRVQNITTTPQTQLSFTGENIDLDKIKELHKYVSGSTANLNGKITTSGLEEDTALSHLSGHIEVEITQGKVVNKEFNDLPQAIGLIERNKSFSYSKTDSESILNCAVMNLQINNGTIQMDKSVAIETSILDMVLSGQVDLTKQTLSVSLKPSLSSGVQNRSLSAVQLIKIKGPLNKPEMSLDTNKIISNSMEKGIGKLMEKTGLGSTNETTSTTTESSSTVRQPLSLCEAALGHKLKGKKNANMPIVQPTTQKPAVSATTALKQPSEEKLTTQEVWKKQLIQSLSSAIQ